MMLPRTYLKPQSFIVYEIEDAQLHTNQLQGLTCWPLEQDEYKNARLTNVLGLTEREGVKTPPSFWRKQMWAHSTSQFIDLNINRPKRYISTVL